MSKEIRARARKHPKLRRPMRYARNKVDITPREPEMKVERKLRRAGGSIRLTRPTATTQYRGK